MPYRQPAGGDREPDAASKRRGSHLVSGAQWTDPKGNDDRHIPLLNVCDRAMGGRCKGQALQALDRFFESRHALELDEFATRFGQRRWRYRRLVGTYRSSVDPTCGTGKTWEWLLLDLFSYRAARPEVVCGPLGLAN
jgi:hypothetical protein